MIQIKEIKMIQPVKDEKPSRLGRGLAALIGDVGEETEALNTARTGQRKLPIAYLRSNPRNPRKTFSQSDLEDLTNSIKEKGIVQPIVVRPTKERDVFEIIAGERRWRASQRAGLHEVPVVVLDVSEREALELAIIENVQRADLDAIEEAGGYQELIDEFSYTQEELAKVIGKSRSHVANTLRLSGLPDSVKHLLRTGALTAGHARAILNAPNIEELAAKIALQNLSVREAEALALKEKGQVAQSRPRAQKTEKDADTRALEKSLSDAMGLRVDIKVQGSGGKVEIVYKSLEQLDELARRLQRS
ncbi:MAG: ParB/RepB/Spo0J family partition protein [Pseudomonadota bacterium]